MNRRKLHRMLAVCFLDQSHPLLKPHILRRYVTSDLLCEYNIRRNTKIKNRDIIEGMRIAINAIQGKPLSYRNAKRGTPIANERRNLILAGLADPEEL